MSLSPEPLIDLSDATSVSSNTSTGSSGSGGGRRRPPPPPKPTLVRSKTAGDVGNSISNDTVITKPLPPIPQHKKPLPALPTVSLTVSATTNRPLPPPPTKQKLGRTASTPPSSRRSLIEIPSPPTRSPPAPPPRRPTVSHHSNSTQLAAQTTPPTSKRQLDTTSGFVPPTQSSVTPPTQSKSSSVEEGKLVDLDSPPLSPGPPVPEKERKPVSLTSQSSFRRTQPVCLPNPVSRELVYEEKEHPRNAFKKLSQLREKGELCDCILSVGDTEIKAHRIVLASCSGYFESMFIGEFSEPEGVPVVIEEVDEHALSTLIDFAYTSCITLTQGNVYNLFEAADTLEFQGVKNACFRFFRSQMNKTNCIRTWLFAESHNCTELLDASLKYIEVNFLNIVRGREFMSVETDTVCRILSLENIAITCEEQVYEAVISWLNYDIEGRREDAYRVLQTIRFPSMNREYLMHITDNEPIIRDDPNCLQLIINAIQSHMTSVRGTLMKKMTKENNSKVLPRAAAMAVEEVELYKSNCSLGVAVMGGSDRPQHIFRQGDKPGIFIRDVISGGAAANSGKIKVGDRILSVNGVDVSNSTHEETIKLLVTSGDPLKLLIRHEPPPEGLKELTLVTKPGEGFGFSFSGGVNGDPANPFDETDEGIFVSEVVPGGAAARDGRLTVGTRILQINSVSLLGKTHQECLKVLQGVLDRMTILVCNGYDPSYLVSNND